MYVVKIRIPARRKRAQQVERRRGLAIGLQHPHRIRRTRRRLERHRVDDVAAIAREFEAVLLFGRLRTRLRELTGNAPDFHDRARGGECQHHCHLQQHAESVANVVRMKFGEALGAITTLQQERASLRHVAQGTLQIARFTCKNERRKGLELVLDGREACGVGIIRHLPDGHVAPRRRGPVGGFCRLAHRSRPSPRPARTKEPNRNA